MIRPYVLLRSLLQSFWARFQIACFHQRSTVFDFLAESPAPVTRPRVLAVITHITKPLAELDDANVAMATDRLQHCLDGLCISLAHCDLTILINTHKDQHLVSGLDECFQKRITIAQQTRENPMFAEYDVPDLFAARREAHDWFLFLEDDLVLEDPLLLNKLAFFNLRMNSDRALLMPNRFETQNGEKHYLDLRWPHPDFRDEPWNRLATLQLGDFWFGQCANIHSGFYALNRAQLDRWLASPMEWRKHVVGAGPLETGGSAILAEVFDIWKSHPPTEHFLEVRHWDSRYSNRFISWQAQQAGVQRRG